MNESRLRRLAGEYARGRLEHDDYLRQRGALIDGIVAGETAIESSAQSTADFAAARPWDRGIRGTRLPLIIGAGVVIAVIWAFLASRETTSPGAGDQTASEQVPGERLRGGQGEDSALNADPATMLEQVAKPLPRETSEFP